MIEYFTLPHRFQVESTYSTWTHGVQEESTWNKTIFFKCGGQLWTPDGLQMDSMESRWSPGGIQLNFIIVIIVMLYIILEHILSWVWKKWFITNYSDVIYHSKALFKLSLKKRFILIIVMLYIILQHFLSWVWKIWFITN